MFTGIITAVGEVRQTKEESGILRVQVSIPADWVLHIGESVNINGVCSTVVAAANGVVTVEYMPETVAVTTVGQIQPNDKLNLECSLTASDAMSGHMVSGHIDAVATVLHILDEGEAHRLTLSTEHPQYLIHKGSVAINGISLTVLDPTADQFQVAIIPHTWKQTNLHYLQQADTVNIEYDMIAKYIERQQQYGNADS